MKLKELINKYEMIVPKELAEDYDNVGLLVGDDIKSLKKILVVLEATKNVVDYAVKNEYDLIFCHHPLIFTPIKNITNDLLGNKLMKLIKNDIAVYVSHTNIDNYEFGLSHFFLSKIGAKDIVRDEDTGVFIGEFDSITVDEIAQKVKEAFDIERLNLVGDKQKKVKKCGVITGSGTSFISDELYRKVDVFLTGDVKYHTANDAFEKDQVLMDITHYGSEHQVSYLFKDILEGILIDSNVKVDIYIKGENPFKSI